MGMDIEASLRVLVQSRTAGASKVQRARVGERVRMTELCASEAVGYNNMVILYGLRS